MEPSDGCPQRLTDSLRILGERSEDELQAGGGHRLRKIPRQRSLGSPGPRDGVAHPDRPDGAEKSATPAADLADIHRLELELELELEQARSEARVMRAERDAAQTIADERQRIIALLEAPRNIPSAAENAHPEQPRSKPAAEPPTTPKRSRWARAAERWLF